MMVKGDGSTTDVEVLVVGAGPTGLALAAELAAYRVDFRIIDRGADRAHESRALAIQPRTLEVLARHDLARPLIEAGNPAVGLRMHTGRRVTGVRLFDIGIADTAYPYLLFLSQAETERILGDHLRDHGVTVEREVALTELETTADQARCRLRHRDDTTETLQARYVVGADGAHSTVRQQAGIGFAGHAYPQTFWLADLEADGLETGAVHAFMAESGPLFFFPLTKPATWRLLTMRPPSTPDTPITLVGLRAIVDRYAHGAVHLRDPVWMTDFHLHNRGATAYRAGRVFLAGDAAHIHSPVGAQGMNTGIQDAVNLGWKLALTLRDLASPALLDTYQSERQPIGRYVLRYTDRAFTIATSTNPLIRLIRGRITPRLAPLALRSATARRYGFRTISQLAIGYRTSRLSAPAPRRRPGGGPRPGDRLPDAPLTRDGQPTTLHTATAAPGYHLLLCGPPTGWPSTAEKATAPWPEQITTHRLSNRPAPGTLHDSDETATRRLRTHPGKATQILIRPDGHIAYRADGTDLTGLRDYLTRWLPPAETT